MSIIIRIYSKAGQNRLTLPKEGTIADLKEAITQKLNIKAPKLCKDVAMRQPYTVSDASTFAAAGFRDGQQVYIANQDVSMNIE